MDRLLLRKAEEFKKKHRRKSIRRKLIRFLGCLVVFCTTYALILPAITQEKATFCGMEEHFHGEHCYVQLEEGESKVLICTEPEVQYHTHTHECYILQEGHTHKETCYALQEKQLVCSLAEVEAHAHSEACYGPGENLLCTNAEAHLHNESCYTQSVLICGYNHEHKHGDGCYGRSGLHCPIEENHAHNDKCYTPETLICESTEEGHRHDAGCYSKRELICSKPEGHAHDDSCYDYSLQCGKEEHAHGDGCWSAPVLICMETENHIHDASCYDLVLMCGLEACEGHAHAEACYVQPSILICGLEESEGGQVLACEIPEEQVHIHMDSCYESVDEPSCGRTEDEEHTHTQLCYGVWNLICAMEEHAHSLICYSDITADVEKESVWIRSFDDVKLTGIWADDVLAIAQTQLGYRESTKNYIVLEDGETIKGYTRYGDWYGLEYEDWCAMFASFCIHYAEVGNMPLEAGCQDWIEKLSARGMYRKAGAYDPLPGDLIFFDWDDDGEADHVGFVLEAADEIETIEGNSGNRVAKNKYKKNDPTILGYGLMPENPDAIVIGDDQSGVYDEEHKLLYVVPNPGIIDTSEVPTVEPTVEPTAEPTMEPTMDATVEPTAEPTMEPTVDVTVEPTTEPTMEPTVEPTMEPTVEPTAEPTMEPTVDATVEPTVEPKMEPTVEPTVEPTMEPTVDATVEPTVEPTLEPTVEPTVEATAEPTMEPTVDATAEPTAESTMEPTVDATAEPTAEPTMEPTVDATVVPTVEPTLEPVLLFAANHSSIPVDTDMLPEAADDKEYLCGLTEHAHAAECYDAEGNLLCAEVEHTHDASCLAVAGPEIEYLCGLTEHVHAEECYDAEGNLLCTEIEHTHDESCLVAVKPEIEYLCGLIEHVHAEECYDAEGNLLCAEVEHTHDANCLAVTGPEIEYLCGLTEHTHVEECYDTEGNLLCTEIEHTHDETCLVAAEPEIEYLCGLIEHVHAEECYDAEGNLLCAEVEHTHDASCLAVAGPEIEYLCGMTEHTHAEECYDAEGNLLCTEIEHTHDEMCCPDEGCFCGQKEHAHTEVCFDDAGNLICIYSEHVHTLVCTMDLRDLNEDIRRQVEELILLIEEMPSADQIDERIMEYELVEDYEGEEAWLTEVYQQVSYIYHRYARLAPEVQERVINRDKLLELEYIWSAVPLVDTEIAHTIAYSPDMFAENALFVVYAKSGNAYYAFDGNGNAVPIIIDADGTIVANTNNKHELLWSFAYQSENTYLIQNAATGRYMHAYPNNGSGVTTSGAYSSVLLETNGGVRIRSNSEYAYLNAVNRVFSMTQSQTHAAVYNFGITYENYVWLDGTNGGLMSLGGSDNTGYLVTDGTFILPESWKSPEKYAYTLRGWYDIINRQYYAPGSEVVVTENMVFYADWVAASYNIGRFNSHVADTESTSSFITTRIYDYSTIFNMYSVTADVTVNAAGHSETWTLNTGADSLNYIFRDWDATGKISYPNNTNADNTNGGVNTGLYNRQLAEMLFGTGSDVLGRQYIGKGDHLFQYGDDPNEPEHYGYYYYDSHLNAASYNRSAGRFYVYDYLERTSDSAGSNRYADFLPFNSPYANTNGKTVQTYSRNGVTNYGYDAKYNTDGNSTNNVGTNYWFGMRTDIEFYLPNSPGTRDSEGNLANSSLYGDEVVFEFSGDDDVWVLVDGNLVLDLGGIHGDEHGSINFSTGVVEVNGTTSGSVRNLSAGNHTLTLLYLERGSSLSNCKIRFNLSSRYALTLQKEDVLTRELLNGAEFSVFTDAACTQPAELWPSQAAHDRGEDGTNVFVVKNGKADMWGLAAGNTYYIKETKSPDGGYDFTRGIIVMQLNNKGVASYDVIADGGSLTGGFTVHGYKVDLESQEAFMAITNGKNVGETTSITVRKRWNDDLDHSGDSITVYLVVDGVRIREETLSAANNWEFTWENMPKYYQDGVTEVNYIIQEGTVSGYVGGVEKLPPGTYQMTDWVRADAFRDGETYLIQSYEGYLSASNGRIYFVADEATAANSSASRWNASVSGGNVYLTNDAGQKLHYSDWRFRAASNPRSGTNLVFDGGRFHYNRGNSELSYICNLASDETGTLNAHTYDSAVIYTPYRRVSETISVPEGDVSYRITNSPVGEEETVSLTVIKEWDLGTLGTTSMYETLTIPVKLMENGVDSGMTVNLSLRNGWTASFTGLPKYDVSGNPVSYSVKEDWISPEWSPHYGEITPVQGSNNSYITTITNVCTLTYMLPETGGCGRTWYTAGGLLLLAAGVILLYKRRYQRGRGER